MSGCAPRVGATGQRWSLLMASFRMGTMSRRSGTVRLFGKSDYPVLDQLNAFFTLAGGLGAVAIAAGAVMLIASFWTTLGDVGAALLGMGIVAAYAGFRARRAYRTQVARLDARSRVHSE